MDTIISQEQRICEALLNEKGMQLVKVTPLMVIVRGERLINRCFSLEMNSKGWAVTVKKANHSDWYYSAIHFNK